MAVPRDAKGAAAGAAAGTAAERDAKPARLERRPRPRRRPPLRLVAALATPLLRAVLAAVALVAFGSYRDLPVGALAAASPREKPAKAVTERELDQLEKLAGIAPKGVYITVDTVENKLRSCAGAKCCATPLCSAAPAWS
jgi:hypothetical protein